MNTSSAAQAISPATVSSPAVGGRPITPPDVAAIRARYSSLRGDFVYLDAPGGTQTPDEVAAAVARVYLEASGNTGAPYATSRRLEALVEEARAA